MLVTIGEAAKRSGVRPSALRYYESVGLLPSLPRSSGRRLYDGAALQRLSMIQLAKRAGFSIGEIRTLVRGPHGTSPSERWHSLAQRKLQDLDSMVAQANEMRRILLRGIKCRCTTLDECVFCAFRHDRQPARAGRNKSESARPGVPSEFLRRQLRRR